MDNLSQARLSHHHGRELGHWLEVNQDCVPAETIDVHRLEFGDSPRLSGEDPEHVRRLAECWDVLPPIIVHRSTMRVIDGVHRVSAALLRGENTIKARFFDGDEGAAFLLAVASNIEHGLPLSLTDRKMAARRLITLFPERSNRWIAASAGLSDKTVSAIRTTSENPHLSSRRLGTDGRQRPVDSAIGRKRAAEIVVNRPDAPLREVAQAAGISVVTARDVRARVCRGDDPVPVKLRAVGNDERSQSDRPCRQFRRIPARDPQAALENLRNDPALRSSEAGRAVLRWLHTRSIERAQWKRLLETIPPHCAELIAGLARGCGEAWNEFAKELQDRSQRTPASTGQMARGQ